MNFDCPGYIGGLKVVESPDTPRYTLPQELLPGVPWPLGFREEINRWSVSFLGTTNIVPEGEVYAFNDTVVMRPADARRLRQQLARDRLTQNLYLGR